MFCSPWTDEVVAIALAAIPTEKDVGVYVYRLPAFDLGIEVLVGVRIRTRNAGADIVGRDVDAHRRVGFAIVVDISHQKLDAVCLERLAKLKISGVGTAFQDIVARKCMDLVEVAVGTLN